MTKHEKIAKDKIEEIIQDAKDGNCHAKNLITCHQMWVRAPYDTCSKVLFEASLDEWLREKEMQ
jgi:hypothetical protein